MPTATPTRPKSYQPARTALTPPDARSIGAQINQLAAEWRRLIAARVLGKGPDPAWIAARTEVEKRLDLAYAQKRQLLAGQPTPVC